MVTKWYDTNGIYIDARYSMMAWYGVMVEFHMIRFLVRVWQLPDDAQAAMRIPIVWHATDTVYIPLPL